jgi:PAS domain S-box-containing protein
MTPLRPNPALPPRGRASLEGIETALLLEGIYRRYGFDFREYAPAWLGPRVRDYVRAESVRSISRLQERLLRDPACFARFATALASHGPSLFRDPGFYRAFRRRVVPGLRGKPQLRLWHLGCATGEDLYSLAVLMQEEELNVGCQVYATELHEEPLRRAARGAFALERLRSGELGYRAAGGRRQLSEYYEGRDAEGVFRAELRKNVVFAPFNHATDSSFNEFDLIVCRNVLPALGAGLQRRVHRLIYQSLARSGVLALGRGEDLKLTPFEPSYAQMDGFETAALIRARERSANTPIIFLTALNDAEMHSSRGYSLGAVDYIHMPVAPDVLKAKVGVFVDLFVKSEQIRRQAEWRHALQEREHNVRLAEAADRLDFETRRNRFFTLAVDMLGIAGFDGYFRQLNPSWQRILGFSEHEMRSAPLSQWLHPDDRELTEAHFTALAEGAPTARFENRHRHRDGSYRWLSWTAAPFREEGLVYVFARDVTELKAAADATLQLVREQEARRAAQRENELKDHFLATLSHELRAPLTPILAWTAVLRSGRLDSGSVTRGLDVIERSVKLQAQLIEDLLDVSRIVSGKLRLDLRLTDLHSVVEAGLDAVRVAAAAKQIAIHFSSVADPIQVLGDPERLQQVVWNLAANAVKFTPDSGRLDVSLDRDGDRPRLSFVDTGVGIRPDFLPHVFDRFRQAETGSARAHGGLGLGLTIVRHLVEGHGGTVEAHSEGRGLGARFVVLFPAHVGEPSSEAGGEGDRPAWPEEAGALPLQGLKLVVVDDDPDICEVLRVCLSQHGARVTVVGSAAAAFEALDRELPDALVCDIGMPGTDGYGLIRRLRARAPGAGGLIPAIAVTAYASREDSTRAHAAGFQVHLAKPLEPIRLVNALAALTGRSGG